MPVTYTNRKGKTSYLHEGVTKTGKPRFYLSPKSEGTLAEAIPEGFEIHETPNAQVFLRKIRPKLISDWELQTVRLEMSRHPHLKHCRMEVEGDTITFFEPNQDDLERTASRLGGLAWLAGREHQEWLKRSFHYTAVLRFVLVDEAKRAFAAERYCFLGSIDRWIPIGLAARSSLAALAHAYVKHVGRESLYELM